MLAFFKRKDAKTQRRSVNFVISVVKLSSLRLCVFASLRLKNGRIWIRKSLAIYILCFLSGCIVGPKYHPPCLEVNDEWITQPCCGIPEEPLEDWWKVFEDPLLDKYIQEAICYNHELAIAEANILEARALRNYAAGRYFPRIEGDITAARRGFSKNGPPFGFQADNQQNPFALIQIPRFQNFFNIAFDATWEIDLFGKTYRHVEFAQAQLASSIESLHDVLLSLLAEMAKSYINLRSSQTLSELTIRNIQLLEEISELTKKRVKSGLANEIDLQNIIAELETVKASLPPVQTQIYLEIYRLSVLTGFPPECLLDELMPTQPLPQIPDCIALGLRSDILRRRPDVRKAERELHAAFANIGIATADFFPTFSLIGSAGLQSLQLKNLFSSDSVTWSYGGNLHFPVFEGGRLKANLHAAQAEAEAAYQFYQQVILTALQDAESSLIAFEKGKETIEHAQKSFKMYELVTDLTRQQYTGGLINLNEFLDSQRRLISSQESLIDSQTAALIHLISLYKALGGGWRENMEFNPDF